MNNFLSGQSTAVPVAHQTYVRHLFGLSQAYDQQPKVVCADAPLVRQEQMLHGWRIKPSGVYELNRDELPANVDRLVAEVLRSDVPVQGWLMFYEPKREIANKTVFLTPQQVDMGKKIMVGAATAIGVGVAAVATVAVLVAVISAILPMLIVGALLLGLATADPVLVACVGNDPDHCTFVQVAAWLDEE